MSYKKFEQGDLLHNVIKAKPRFEFKIFKGNIFLNDSSNGYSLLNSFGEPAFAALPLQLVRVSNMLMILAV